MKKVLAIGIALLMWLSPISAYASAFGVDVSHNNAAVDFVSLKNEGKQFAMIRIGYYNHLDKKFWEHVRACAEAQMEFGVYLYSYAFNEAEAQIEADFVLSVLQSLAASEYAAYFTLPVAYDLEDEKLMPYGKSQITRNMQVFCSAVQTAGYVPMVYANREWFEQYVEPMIAVQNGWKIWYAKWENEPDFSTPKQVGNSGVYADIWQYGKGIYDWNIAYDMAALKQIIPRRLSLQDAVIAGEKDKTYTGKAQTQHIEVRLGETLLAENTDYTVSYRQNTKVGTAEMLVTGIGNYEGILKKTFKILPPKTSLQKVTAGKKSCAVKWKKQTAQVTGYQIQYATKKNFKGAKTVTVKGAGKTVCNVKKLKSKKTYYIRMRPYKTVNKKTYYAAWSGKKKVKVM